MQNKFLAHIKPLLYLSKICGLAFFSLKQNSDLRSKLQEYVWFAPLFIYYVFSLTYGLAEFNTITYFNSNIVIRTSDLLQIVTSALHVGTSVVSSIKYKDSCKNILKSVSEVDDALSTRCLSPIYRKILILLCAELIVVLVDVKFVIGPHFNVFYYSSYAMPAFLHVFEFFFIYQVMNGLHMQFIAINDVLCHQIKFVEGLRSQKIPQKSNLSQETLNRILHVLHVHYQMGKLAVKANEIFGMQILTALGVTFLILTTSIHFLTSSSMKMLAQGSFDVIVISVTCWIFLMSFTINYSIKPWDLVSREAKKTATYVHDIWNKYASENEIDSNVNHLQLISLQLLNSQLNFTAYGFFPLDWTLLQAIIGAVTTYVVILIQFEMS